MKKRALAILMAALTASTMFAVPTFAQITQERIRSLRKTSKSLPSGQKIMTMVCC